MHRRLLTTCALIVGLLAPATAGAAEERIVVRDVTLSQYPRVQLELTLPSSLVGQARTEPTFSVKENGRPVELLTKSSSKAEPVDVVLVIDTSGSMEGRSMEAAKAAATAFVAKLNPGSRVAIVSFADKPRVVAQLTSDATELNKSVSRLNPRGETALYDALALAARESARAEVRRPVIVLLSDGGDTVSRVSLDEAVKDLVKVGSPALVVALPSAEADFSVLRSVAKRTGGRFSTVANSDELTAFYQRLAEELQTAWTVTYVSRRPSTNDLDIVARARVGDRQAAGEALVPNPVFAQSPTAGREALSPVPPASMLTLASATALVFLAVFALVAAVGLMFVRPRNTLDQLRYYDQLRGSEGHESADDPANPVTASVLGAVDYVAGKRGIKRLAYEQLERAGLPLRPVEYITAHFIAVIAVGLLAELLTGSLFVSVVAVVLATFVPIAYLDYRVGKRRDQFNRQLPDVLNLIAGSLRSGWGLQQSLSLVVEQMPAPVSTEFSRAETEVRLGRPIEAALEAVARRMQSTDFTWAVTAIAIQRDVGGNLAEVLDIVAATIRDKGALQRQISALTAEGRLSAWILMALPFVLVMLISVVNPVYLAQLYLTPQGIAMLVTGVVLLVVGAVWLRNVVKIEV